MRGALVSGYREKPAGGPVWDLGEPADRARPGLSACTRSAGLTCGALVLQVSGGWRACRPPGRMGGE